MKIIKKIVKVGVDSLMIVLPKEACKKMKLKQGDYAEINFKKVEQ